MEITSENACAAKNGINLTPATTDGSGIVRRRSARKPGKLKAKNYGTLSLKTVTTGGGLTWSGKRKFGIKVIPAIGSRNTYKSNISCVTSRHSIHQADIHSPPIVNEAEVAPLRSSGRIVTG